MQTIYTSEAATPAGHYSQAVVHSDTVYVSGLLAVDPATGDKNLGSIEDQASQILDNLEAILKAAGSDLAHVLKVNVYITDISLWSRFNAVYAQRMGAHKPARVVVPTPTLHHGFAIELDCIAAVVSA